MILPQFYFKNQVTMVKINWPFIFLCSQSCMANIPIFLHCKQTSEQLKIANRKIVISSVSQQCKRVPEKSFPEFPRQDAVEHGVGAACRNSVWGAQTPADSFLTVPLGK